MISEVDINDNSEICSEKDLYPSNKIDNIDSEEDVDIYNKIKRTREKDDVNVYQGQILKKFEDEFENKYSTTGGKTWYDTNVYCDEDDELNEEEERLIMEEPQEQFLNKDEFDCDSGYQYTGGKEKLFFTKCSKNITNKL
jgi:hypothetical protein